MIIACIVNDASFDRSKHLGGTAGGTYGHSRYISAAHLIDGAGSIRFIGPSWLLLKTTEGGLSSGQSYAIKDHLGNPNAD